MILDGREKIVLCRICQFYKKEFQFKLLKLCKRIYILDSLISLYTFASSMIHKIQYFEAEKLPQGTYLQDVVNKFLAEKGENVVAIHPVMGKSLLVHFKDEL